VVEPTAAQQRERDDLAVQAERLASVITRHEIELQRLRTELQAAVDSGEATTRRADALAERLDTMSARADVQQRALDHLRREREWLTEALEEARRQAAACAARGGLGHVPLAAAAPPRLPQPAAGSAGSARHRGSAPRVPSAAGTRVVVSASADRS
jgi:hypothetical protein